MSSKIERSPSLLAIRFEPALRSASSCPHLSAALSRFHAEVATFRALQRGIQAADERRFTSRVSALIFEFSTLELALTALDFGATRAALQASLDDARARLAIAHATWLSESQRDRRVALVEAVGALTAMGALPSIARLLTWACNASIPARAAADQIAVLLEVPPGWRR